VSVVAPPDTPPEVQRPYDQGTEPSTPRVTKYRAWTRGRQVWIVGVTVTALLLATAICVAGGQEPWAVPLGKTAAQFAIVAIAWTVVQVVLGLRALRRRIQWAWMLPEGAYEDAPNLMRVLAGVPAIRSGALGGVILGLAAVIVGDDTRGLLVAGPAALCVGGVLALELRLRLVVERADPQRTYFVSLDEDEDSAELFWRFAGA
jgi:hypothetical protein